MVATYTPKSNASTIQQRGIIRITVSEDTFVKESYSKQMFSRESDGIATLNQIS